VDQSEARRNLEEEQARLLDARGELEPEVSQDEGAAQDPSELSGVDQHPADLGTETFEREKDLSILESTDGQLRDIDRAFERLEDGSYGTCEVCGRPIGDERLRARPATRFCVEHQREAERDTFSPRA
jgi:RNA polymerase-binding transcription factor DksA